MPRLQVSIVNDQQALAIDRRRLRRLVRRTLRDENVTDGAVTVLITGDARMRDLSGRFLDRPRATDVLAFPEAAGGEAGEGASENRGTAEASDPRIKMRGLGGEGFLPSRAPWCADLMLSPDFPETGRSVGEVAVNAERACREARRRGLPDEAELLLYVVHGLLHLVGYNDNDPTDARRMHEREDAVLQAFGFADVDGNPVRRTP